MADGWKNSGAAVLARRSTPDRRRWRRGEANRTPFIASEQIADGNIDLDQALQEGVRRKRGGVR